MSNLAGRPNHSTPTSTGAAGSGSALTEPERARDILDATGLTFGDFVGEEGPGGEVGLGIRTVGIRTVLD